jgi:hypothetical protein
VPAVALSEAERKRLLDQVVAIVSARVVLARLRASPLKGRARNDAQARVNARLSVEWESLRESIRTTVESVASRESEAHP